MFPYQPIKFIIDVRADFIQGNIIKYVTRYRYKGGIEDLRKAIHYCDIAEELNVKSKSPVTISKLQTLCRRYVKNNELTDLQYYAIQFCCSGNYKWVKRNLKEIIKKEEANL